LSRDVNNVGDIKPDAKFEFFFYQYVGADAAAEKAVPRIPQQHDKAVEAAKLLRASR
jgi:hypothetical protein